MVRHDLLSRRFGRVKNERTREVFQESTPAVQHFPPRLSTERFSSDAEPLLAVSRWSMMRPWRVQKPVRQLLPGRPQNPLNRGCPRTWPGFQARHDSIVFALLSPFPSFVPLFLFPGQRSGRDRQTLRAGKLNNDAEEIPPRRGLPENVGNRVFSVRPCSLNQRLAKTNLFNLFGLNSVTSDMIDSFPRPDEFVNLHSPILRPTGSVPAKVCAESNPKQTPKRPAGP